MNHPTAQVIEGHLSAQGLKFAVISARFNSFIVEQLELGALDATRKEGRADRRL